MLWDTSSVSGLTVTTMTVSPTKREPPFGAGTPGGGFLFLRMVNLTFGIPDLSIPDSLQKSSAVQKVYRAGLCPTSPSRLRRATSPCRRGLGSPRKVNGSARGSPTRGNGDDRRQRRKQGVAVGAAASRMQATAQQTLGAATRPCLRSRLRGWTKTEPFLCRKVRLVASLPVSFCRCLWYTGSAVHPRPSYLGREVKPMIHILTILESAVANIISHYICKWLDRLDKDRKPD